jgi:response regulator of citrate/malate metabolism
MQVFQHQAVDYLLKPFSYHRFAEAMLNFAQFKQKMQQQPLPLLYSRIPVQFTQLLHADHNSQQYHHCRPQRP